MRLEMLYRGRLRLVTAGTIAGIILLPLLNRAQARNNTYMQVNLVSNGYVPAKVIDHNLVNPWGVAAGPTNPLWISDQGSNTLIVAPISAVENGSAPPLTVSVPTLGGGPNGPTGIVYNLASAANGFGIPSGSGMSTVPPIYIFTNLNGTILGWSPKSSGGVSQAVVAVDNHTSMATYTGLTMAAVGQNTYLYVANFAPNGGIQVFNSSWQMVTDFGNEAFEDPRLPRLPASEVWAPYNIANLNGKIYVAYDAIPATGGLPITHMGLGVIGVFTLQGQFIRNLEVDPGHRDMANGNGIALGRAGQLDAPWGMVMAPAKFGRFSNELLVGNFGNGQILAFRADGKFDDTLRGTDHHPLKNGFLWSLWFGNGQDGAEPTTLYITTGGPNEATDGLLAAITAAPANNRQP
ncbi:MAG: TIGR03118 family protein [Acidobacteriaceae bacterium]